MNNKLKNGELLLINAGITGYKLYDSNFGTVCVTAEDAGFPDIKYANVGDRVPYMAGAMSSWGTILEKNIEMPAPGICPPVAK